MDIIATRNVEYMTEKFKFSSLVTFQNTKTLKRMKYVSGY